MLFAMRFSDTLVFGYLVTWAIGVGSEPDPEPAGQLLHHTIPAQPQNLIGVISSIEERLRSLDNQYALRFAAPRWELSVETHNRKLEALETKLARIETLLEVRIDKLTENLSSKTLKEELNKEQLSRKVDFIYERLNHRMSFMEQRIENNIAKFQSSLDTTLTRTNTQLEHLEKFSGDVENDIIELTTVVEESRTMLQQIVNNTLRQSANETWQEPRDHSEILNQVANYTSQALATCQEASTRSRSSEEMTRKSLDLVNANRRELQEGVKVVKANANRRHQCPTIPDSSIDYLIEKVDEMGRKSEGNHQKLDTSLGRLHMRQELYQESCHRLQEEEPQIENRIADILEKIITSLENRTYTTDKNYETLLERLKSHHNSVIRTVAHTTNTVMKLSEQMTNDVKSLHTNHPASHKIDQIILSLQELQDEFQELNATITSAHQLTPSQSQVLLNNTATILRTIQNLNENMSTIIDRLSDYYRNVADSFEPETDLSARVFQIFNMTEADLTAVVLEKGGGGAAEDTAIANVTAMGEGGTNMAEDQMDKGMD